MGSLGKTRKPHCKKKQVEKWSEELARVGAWSRCARRTDCFDSVSSQLLE